MREGQPGRPKSYRKKGTSISCFIFSRVWTVLKLIFYSCILQPIHKQTTIYNKKLVGTTYTKTII
jgi:hypothetical protein